MKTNLLFLALVTTAGIFLESPLFAMEQDQPAEEGDVSGEEGRRSIVTKRYKDAQRKTQLESEERAPLEQTLASLRNRLRDSEEWQRRTSPIGTERTEGGTNTLNDKCSTAKRRLSEGL